jgi:ectoine hydroxylase-related dioxygenase (phytanoyl-CoA dioxygenase family)
LKRNKQQTRKKERMRVKFIDYGSSEWIRHELKTNGYVLVPNVLTQQEVTEYKADFHHLMEKNQHMCELHPRIGVHGIFKFGPFAQSLMRSKIVTNDKVVGLFESLYGTRNLVTSQDGCAYIPSDADAKTKSVWTHVDQAPSSYETVNEADMTREKEYENGKKCVQGFVALTTNEERTFRVYPKSHVETRKWFLRSGKTGTKNWHKLEREELEGKEYKDLHVPAGSAVLWDSRSWHQNTNSAVGEERLVVYVCMLPRENPLNTAKQAEKRLKYFETKRMTSHWPYTVHVNGEQPQTYGDETMLIDYERVVYDELPKELEEKYLALLR